MPVDIFADRIWQMSLGERAAVEGVLAQLRPSLAVEIGTAEGSCLQRIAAHAGIVHSFDLTAPTLPVPDNVRLHTGDSHQLLPRFLAELAGHERNVDFVIVDGDHSPEGVRRDLEDLLDSPALARTVILIHDTANPRVRSGLDAVRFAAWPKVAHVELDWIPGRLFAEPALRNELWYGLGLVLLDAARPAYFRGEVYEQRYHPAAELLAEIREIVVTRALAPAGVAQQDDLGRLRHRVLALTAELSRARMREQELLGRLSLAGRRAAAGVRARQILRRVQRRPGGRTAARVLRRLAASRAGRAARARVRGVVQRSAHRLG